MSLFNTSKEARLYLSMAVLLGGLLLAEFISERVNNEQFIAEARLKAMDQLWVMRSRLEGNLIGDVQLVKGLVSLIATLPNMTQDEFSKAAKPLFESSPSLRNIGAAPDMVIRLVHPLASNEKALGLDYRTVPDQFELADRARRTGQIVLAGPLRLVQGGSGIISRMPVMVENNQGEKTFWGLISAVIDAERLYVQSGLTQENLPLEIALRAVDGNGAQGEVFYGRAALFAANPILANVELPGLSWQMAAAPKVGWPIESTGTWALRGLFLLIAMLVIIPFITLARSVRMEEEKNRLLRIVEDAPDYIGMSDLQGRLQFHNSAALRMIGLSESADLTSMQIRDMHPDWAARLVMEEGIPAVLREGHWRHETAMLHRDGHEIPVSQILLLHRDASGKPQFLSTIIRDITELKKAEAQLQLAASVFSSAREGILITDSTGRIVDANDAFTRITSFTREDVIGQNPRLLKSNRHPPEFYQEMWKSIKETGFWTGEIWNRRKDGQVYAEMRTISAVCDTSGTVHHYVALFSDITPQKERQERLEHFAHYDALTNLPNRVLLSDRLQQAMIQAQRREQMLAVIFVDLDGFKRVNDTFGHLAGDQLLTTVAHRMTKALREGDTLARVGGDEFVAVVIDLGEAQLCDVIIQRLLKAAAEPVDDGNVSMQVSASIGITLYPKNALDAEELLRQADCAMYQAKQSGKNRYHLFDVSQDTPESTQPS